MNACLRLARRVWFSFCPASVVLASFLAAACAAADDAAFEVYPTEFKVSHPRFPQSLLVSRRLPDGTQADLTREAKYHSADPKITRVDSQGRVWPVGAGETTIEVTAGGDTARVAVQSHPLPDETPVSYLNEIQPILSQARCNQGACHGYSLGKNGFKLSLRGMDPAADYPAITREFFSRRIDVQNPAASILLGKPAGDVSHQGGVRLKKDSDAYQRLLRWISEDAPSDLGKAPELVGVEIYPRQRVLTKPGSQQQMVVTARYADGTSCDVTSLAIFTSNQEMIAEVNDAGLVTMLTRGAAAIQVRYERLFAVSNLIALDGQPGFAWSNPPERNFVDKHAFARLRDLRINPSELSSDAEFLRRVSLDLIGVQPKLDELREFLADTSPAKRDMAIERLLERPEFIDHWSLKWGDLLQNSRKFMPEESMYAFRDWLRYAVAANMPFDQFAREVLTGSGAVREQATAAFYRVSTDAKISLERTAQVFTGVRMLCARCHPHPFENWTQADYYGMASFFNQVADKVDYLDPKDKIIVVKHQAPLAVNPRTNKPQPPRFLGGGEPEIKPGSDRRFVFAQWLTSKDNPHFARSIVNRYWSYFFSRGIINPVDDLRNTNPPINPDLLDALTKDFVEHDFDVRHLMRTIVQSRTYQLSSVTNPSNAADNDNFSHAVPRRLSAEQMLDCVTTATGVAEVISGAPSGFRAAQSPDSEVSSEFLDLFGRAARMEACECERSSDTNMLQALHMINGNTLLQKVTNANSFVARVAANAKLSPEQRVEEIYLGTVCRTPSTDELKVSLGYVEKAAAPLEGYQDLMWALLNSSDFLFVK